MHATVAVLALLLATSAAAQAAPAPQHSPCRPQHLRLYVYTTPDIRPRHVAVVQKALERRAAVHSSGFAEVDGAPRLAIGAVADRVFHWRQRDGAWYRNTSMPCAWPFVAVLEYDGRGAPRAWIDWFRRAKGSRDGGAWAKDPADERYARHISDASVTDQDDRFAYLAIVDTPTGGVVWNNEWVVRARVEWPTAAVTKRAGHHVQFDGRGSPVADWAATVAPLVDWFVVKTPGRADLAGTHRVALPASQLAVFGTNVVFTLPPIPDDVTPARGFPAPDGQRSGARVASHAANRSSSVPASDG